MLRNTAERDALRLHGYVHFRTHSARDATLDIARRLGSISSLPNIPCVQELCPREAESAASSYSGLYGLGSFPLHTDMAHWARPPRYLLLRCVRPAVHVRTLLLHCRDVFAGEDELTLRLALFRPRRRLEARLTCLRLFEKGQYRWDPVFIEPVSRRAKALRERILERIDTYSPIEFLFGDPQDCLILDNWNVLHGRTSVPKECMDRKVERVYFDSVAL